MFEQAVGSVGMPLCYQVEELSSKSIRLTEHMIDSYLEMQREKGLSSATIYTYQAVLRQMYRFLPENKLVNEFTSDRWKKELGIQGYEQKTIHGYCNILGNFLNYLKIPQKAVVEKKSAEATVKGYLTRDEYLLLLQTAKLMGRKRAYLLIKTMVNAGFRTRELHELTVEALREGVVFATSYGMRRRIPLMEPLREELLDFAQEQGTVSGPLFVTKDGQPMLHSAVWKEVKLVCRQMGISEEKGTTRNLYQLYLETYREICRNHASEGAAQGYRQLLEREELSVAWDR